MCDHAGLFHQVKLHGMAQAGDDAFLLFLGEQ
jgi:hypothetical protein